VKQLFLKDKTNPLSPDTLFSAFKERFPQFGDGQQHDAQEVVIHMIDVFERSLGKEFIMDLFNGEEVQETVWDGGRSVKRTPFTTLFLDVSEPCRLHDLLTPKTFSIENYKDDSGKVHEHATVQTRVDRWPKFISFTFSMYDYKFPIEIPLDFEGRVLFACIVHMGSRHGGHYALVVRRFDKWYIKDDASVTEVHEPPRRGAFYQVWYRPKNSLS
jgi:ubiquitin C-terminal hydrolase